MKTTSGHPMPMSRRLAPVMLASASGAYVSGSLAGLGREREVDGVLREHGDEREHREREATGDVELEASAPHASRNAAPTTAKPKITAPATSVGCEPPRRRTTPGSVSATAAAIASPLAAGVLDGRGGVAGQVLLRHDRRSYESGSP